MDQHRKIRIGKVVSDRGEKTIIVATERPVRHPLYGRILRRIKKLAAHDEGNIAKVGDIVELIETRPLSKTKHWRLLRVIESAK
ncbi:MAG TPA: 30S ribosomal protein S17 [Candidatus Latescibacteria bacterium]|nr:30S ribosomal protein S17 [Candidatus Latescibacterota bacterium]